MSSEHKTEDQILAEIEKASSAIEIGAVYEHYKSHNKTYKVTGLGTFEASDELCVIYQAQYGNKLTFVRLVDSWLEQVDWEGRKVPRFNKNT